MALTDNLVAYYKFDESSGNASDSSGNSNTLTNTNSTYTNGKINNGATFNGSDRRFQAADSSSLSITGNITISCWVNATSLPSSGNLMSLVNKWDDGANAGGYELRLYNNSGTQKIGLVTVNSTGSIAGDVSYTLNTGTWYHIVGVYNGSNSEIYVNGSSIGTVSNNKNPDNNTKLLNIGNFGYYTPSSGELGRYFNGMLDEIGIWSRALSSTEISQLYNSGAGLQYPFTTGNTSNFFMFF